MMALDHALKTFAFTHANYVNKFFAVEHFYQYAVACFHRRITINFDRDFLNELHWRQIVLRQVSAHRLRQPRLFHEFYEANLCGFIAVFSLGLCLRDHAWPRLQHGRRTHLTVRVEELRHADFFPQNSCYLCHFLLHPSLAFAIGWGACYLCSFPKALISTSTP